MLDAFTTASDETESNPDILEEGKHFHRLMEYFTAQTSTSQASLPSEQELAIWLNIEVNQAATALARAQTVINTPALKPYLTAGNWSRLLSFSFKVDSSKFGANKASSNSGKLP